MSKSRLGNSIEVIVRAIIIQNEEILLCVNPKTKIYYLPGGHLEFGETIVDCLRREMREETGREIGDIEILTAIENFYAREGQSLHEINILTKAKILGADLESIRPLEPGVTYAWIPAHELPAVKILPESVKKYALRANKNRM